MKPHSDPPVFCVRTGCDAIAGSDVIYNVEWLLVTATGLWWNDIVKDARTLQSLRVFDETYPKSKLTDKCDSDSRQTYLMFFCLILKVDIIIMPLDYLLLLYTI